MRHHRGDLEITLCPRVVYYPSQRVDRLPGDPALLYRMGRAWLYEVAGKHGPDVHCSRQI